MAIETLLIILLCGAIAGWLAGVIVRGFGFGLLGNIVVGIVGGLLGTWLLRELSYTMPGGPWLSLILTALLGAVVLLVLVGVIRDISGYRRI